MVKDWKISYSLSSNDGGKRYFITGRRRNAILSYEKPETFERLSRYVIDWSISKRKRGKQKGFWKPWKRIVSVRESYSRMMTKRKNYLLPEKTYAFCPYGNGSSHRGEPCG
jgi:hypothetical protein